jgi:hypothetical protein
MSKKLIPFPPPSTLGKHREMAGGHCRVNCYICGKRYALDFRSSACELNPADAVVLSFPSGRLPIKPKVASELPCVSSPSGVIHVMTANRATPRTTTMTTFARHTPRRAFLF